MTYRAIGDFLLLEKLKIIFLYVLAVYFFYTFAKNFIYDITSGAYSSDELVGTAVDALLFSFFVSLLLTPVLFAISEALSRARLITSFIFNIFIAFSALQMAWLVFQTADKSDSFQAKNSICVTHFDGSATSCGVTIMYLSTLGILTIAAAMVVVVIRMWR